MNDPNETTPARPSGSGGPPPLSVGARITLILVSTLLSLAAVELALSVVGFEYLPLKIEVTRPDDARAYHLFEDEYFTYDPDLIWRPKRSYRIFNAQGFRGPELPATKAAGEYRVFTIGDSNTLGWAGEDGPNWPRYLGEQLAAIDRGITVVNAGVWGYSSYQGLRRFRETLAYHPDLVLISFGSNDAHRVTRPDRDYTRATWGLVDPERVLSRFRLGQVALGAWRGISSGGEGELVPRVSVDEYRANLGTIIEEARASHVAVVLMTRPYVGEVDNPILWKQFANHYTEATVQVATERGVPVADLYSLFKAQDEYFADESHFTEEGHRIAASFVLDTVRPLITR